MEPTIGRIVHYHLAAHDIAAIAARGPIGNAHYEGATAPAVIVAVWGGSGVNLHVLLDGPQTYWATSRLEGEAPGQWSWPPRA